MISFWNFLQNIKEQNHMKAYFSHGRNDSMLRGHEGDDLPFHQDRDEDSMKNQGTKRLRGTPTSPNDTPYHHDPEPEDYFMKKQRQWYNAPTLPKEPKQYKPVKEPEDTSYHDDPELAGDEADTWLKNYGKELRSSSPASKEPSAFHHKTGKLPPVPVPAKAVKPANPHEEMIRSMDPRKVLAITFPHASPAELDVMLKKFGGVS